MNRCFLYNLPDTFLFIFIIFLLQYVSGSCLAWNELQPLDTFLQNGTGSHGTVSSEDLNLSLLNCILIFQWHFFSSPRQFQTRALSFCRLPASSGFLFIIYFFVLITNKKTNSTRWQEEPRKTLLYKSSHFGN